MFIGNQGLDRETIAKRWWLLVIRGLAALALGVLAIAWPSASLFALVVVWGAYALIDGMTSVALAVRAKRVKQRWGWFLFDGLAGIAVAAVTLVWPQITAFALLMLVAAWAVITGMAKVVAAVELRRVIRGEWILCLSGLLSIAFGVLVMLFPQAGALAVVTLIGVWAIAFGALLTFLGFRVRSLAAHGMTPPAAGTPERA